MKSPTIEEKFTILTQISEVPIEACRVAYDRLDSILAGRHTDDLNKNMATGGTTRSWVSEFDAANLATRIRTATGAKGKFK
jgi:hypothetical protein